MHHRWVTGWRRHTGGCHSDVVSIGHPRQRVRGWNDSSWSISSVELGALLAQLEEISTSGVLDVNQDKVVLAIGGDFRTRALSKVSKSDRNRG